MGILFFYISFMHVILFITASSTAPQIPLLRRIEPRTVVILALTDRRSNHSVRSHPQTRLDLIHRLGQISSTDLARSHPQTQLYLIHKLGYRSHPQTRVQISSTNSASSHPQLGQISSLDSARSQAPLGQISFTNSARFHPNYKKQIHICFLF